MRSWYVVRTHPRAEAQVGKILTSKELPLYLPQAKARKTHRTTGQGKWVYEPFFPGYLFAQLDIGTEDWLIARSAPGVSYILGQHSGGVRIPVAVPDTLVETIRERLELEDEVQWDQRFQSGDQVRILTGPFRGLEAVFDRTLSGRRRVQVLLSIVSRLVPIELDAEDLQRVS